MEPLAKRQRHCLSRGEPARIGLDATVYDNDLQYPARVVRVSKGKKKVIVLQYKRVEGCDEQILRQSFSLRPDNSWVLMGIRMEKPGPRAVVWQTVTQTITAESETSYVSARGKQNKTDASCQTESGFWVPDGEPMVFETETKDDIISWPASPTLEPFLDEDFWL